MTNPFVAAVVRMRKKDFMPRKTDTVKDTSKVLSA
jgi:hypothetical protein